MYRCPRCNVKLAPDAYYCPSCGFNQTNARMQSVASQPTTESNALATPAAPDISTNPSISTERAPTPLTPQSSSPPSLQPEVKPAIPPRPSLNEQVPSPAARAAPAALSTQQVPPSQPENIQQQEVKDVPPTDPVRPVKTNTPPRPKQAYKLRPYSNQSSSSVDQAHPQADETKLEVRQGQVDGTNAQEEFTLTKRYMAEQETRQQPAFPNAVETLSEMPSANPIVSTNRGKSEAGSHSELHQGVGATSTMVHPLEAALDFTGEGAESLIATSKAAEHWRQSWLDRQRAEAGPAVGITRGQADVPEPLMAMQNSIARMRAIILPKNTTSSTGKNVGFWIALILLLCIIGGMGAYVISTYAPSTQLATQISGTGNISPTLTMQGTHARTITAGQTLHVHGTDFGANHAITFLLDTTPLSATPVQSNNNGTFNASLTIPTTWLAGDYALQAQDNQDGLHAFLDLPILPDTLTISNNTPLVLTINDLSLSTSGLTFKTVMDQASATVQHITLTNSSDTPVQWSASAIAANNSNWLVITNGKTGGTLATNEADSIGISVNTTGLPSSTTPYRGSVILTVDQTQAIIPISLTVQDTAPEVVVNPDPVIAYLRGGGTCQPTALTLINLSSQFVTWNVNPYDMDKPHIHLDGLTADQGVLDPGGEPGDTKVIQITCIRAQVGENLYHISVYYNGVGVKVPITVQHSPKT